MKKVSAMVLMALIGALLINFIPATIFYLIISVALKVDLGYWTVYWGSILLIMIMNMTKGAGY